MATVEVDESELEKYRKAYEAQHKKYGQYTDEEIDNYIDIRVQSEKSAWLAEMANADLQAAIQEIAAKADGHQQALKPILEMRVDLRDKAFEEYVSAPVWEPPYPTISEFYDDEA